MMLAEIMGFSNLQVLIVVGLAVLIVVLIIVKKKQAG